MPVRELVTLHAPMASIAAAEILKPATDLMDKFGFPWWVSASHLPDIVLVVDCPQVWHERGPTQRELDHFFKLYDSGLILDAQEFAQTGWPEYLR